MVSPFQLHDKPVKSFFRPTFLVPLKSKHHWPIDLQISQGTLKHPQGQMEFCKGKHEIKSILPLHAFK